MSDLFFNDLIIGNEQKPVEKVNPFEKVDKKAGLKYTEPSSIWKYVDEWVPGEKDIIFSSIVGAYLIGKNLGGQIILFSSSNILNTLPNMNGGYDKNMTKEQLAYSALDKKKLRNIGINLTNENIGCNIFASADSQINTFTLNQICEYTNGHLYFFKKFNMDLHYKNIFNQIRRVLTRPIAWEGVNRTRFSLGYRISSYSTPILITNGDLFVFPTTDSDQNYLFSVSPPPSKTEDGEGSEKKNDFNNRLGNDTEK